MARKARSNCDPDALTLSLASCERMNLCEYTSQTCIFFSYRFLRLFEGFFITESMMDNREEKFGELRSFFQQSRPHNSLYWRGACKVAWKQLCALLDSWKQDEYFLEVVIPYVRTHTAPWDAEAKLAPYAWVKPLLRKTKKPAPLLSLATGLNLQQSSIGPKSVKHLANSPEIEHITTINLVGNNIGDEGALALCQSPYLTHLTGLDLAYTRIGDQGAIAIANCKNFESLEWICFALCALEQEGCDAIRNSPFLCPEIRAGADEWDSRGFWSDTDEYYYYEVLGKV